MKNNDDEIIVSLKARYFSIIAKENYPKTPEITKEADKIEKWIRQFEDSKRTLK